MNQMPGATDDDVLGILVAPRHLRHLPGRGNGEAGFEEEGRNLNRLPLGPIVASAPLLGDIGEDAPVAVQPSVIKGEGP